MEPIVASSEPIVFERPSRMQVILCAMLGGLAGQFSGRAYAMLADSSPPQAASLTTFGNVFFFVIGAVAAVSISWAVLQLLRPRVPTLLRTAAELVAITMIGLVAGVAGILCFFMTCFSGPRDLVELLIQ